MVEENHCESKISDTDCNASDKGRKTLKWISIHTFVFTLINSNKFHLNGRFRLLFWDSSSNDSRLEKTINRFQLDGHLMFASRGQRIPSVWIDWFASCTKWRLPSYWTVLVLKGRVSRSSVISVHENIFIWLTFKSTVFACIHLFIFIFIWRPTL